MEDLRRVGFWNETGSTQREDCDLMYATGMPTVRITVDGKLALTVEQAADRYGLKPPSMRGELTRLGDSVSTAAMLDGRKPLYLAAELDALMRARPGRGAPGKPRPRI